MDIFLGSEIPSSLTKHVSKLDGPTVLFAQDSLYEPCLRGRRNVTCLCARVVKGGRGFDRHRGDSAVRDLGARIPATASLGHLLRLGGLATEVAAAHHLLRGGLSSEAAGDKDLFRRCRLPPVVDRAMIVYSFLIIRVLMHVG